MKQTIIATRFFPDLSKTIKIQAVYLVNNRLIAVSKIIPTRAVGEAVAPRKDKVYVETNQPRGLKVTHYFIDPSGNDGVKQIEDIKEIAGLEPLPFVNKRDGASIHPVIAYDLIIEKIAEAEQQLSAVQEQLKQSNDRYGHLLTRQVQLLQRMENFEVPHHHHA